jgi:hypothetical protein
MTRRQHIIPFLLAASVVAALGCQTASPTGSSSLASVLVKTRDLDRIEAAVRQVFDAHDYRERSLANNRFIFERPGNRLDQAAYGGWLDDWVWERVKGYLRKRDDHTTLIEFNVYKVRNHGDAYLEEEHRLWKVRAGPYQAMLDELQALIDSPPPPGE